MKIVGFVSFNYQNSNHYILKAKKPTRGNLMEYHHLVIPPV